MPGKKEKLEEPLLEPAVEPTESEPQPKTFTREELDALLAEVKTEAEKQYQGIQRVVSQKDRKIQELEARTTQPSVGSDDDLYEVMLQDRKSKATEFGEPDPMIAYFEGKIAQRKQTQTKARQDAYYKQADAVYKEAEEVFGDDIDTLYNIRNFIRAGDFDLAEKKIAKAKSVKPTEPKGKETETEEERVERLAEEKLRVKMEEKGLLTTETGGPSGTSGSTISVAAFQRMSPQERLKLFKEKPNITIK